MINNDDINKENMAEFAQEPLSTLPADIDCANIFRILCYNKRIPWRGITVVQRVKSLFIAVFQTKLDNPSRLILANESPTFVRPVRERSRNDKNAAVFALLRGQTKVFHVDRFCCVDVHHVEFVTSANTILIIRYAVILPFRIPNIQVTGFESEIARKSAVGCIYLSPVYGNGIRYV